MFGSNTPSLADIAAVTDNNRNNGGFGDGNGWWVLIILFALFGGWGNWGNNRGGGGSGSDGSTTIVTVPTPGYGGGMGMGYGFESATVQRGFDNQAVVTKLDGINNGICSLGYDQLAQMNGINTNIMQTGFGLQQAINNDTVANMQNTNALSRQFSDCCCDLKAGLKDIQYSMATDTCAINNAVHQTGDAIIQNQNQGFQMLNQTINNGFTNLAMAQKDQQIAELQAKLNNCDRDSALQGTASYIINSVRPTPVPAWPVSNPWAGCNCNSGCGNSCGSCC